MSKNWKLINPPSKEMKKYYGDLYKRNQMKFIRRSVLEMDHLGSEFDHAGKKYKLIGTMNSLEMVVENLSDQTFHIVDSVVVTNLVLGSK
jgi:hypothetical protein